MSRSISALLGKHKGTSRINFNFDAIDRDTAVVVTAAEFQPQSGGPPFGDNFLTPGRPHLGAAPVYVTNIGPHGDTGEPGGVEFLLHVDSDDPVDVVVTITALGKIEQFNS
ncbi:hypothetical protein [Streptomyces sp. NPDC001657]|uniref:hypothetical protein n=1 Tax=Streptomyces sp. NPDC001657 TaxID=3154522 RepID=UPI00331B523D